MPSEPPVRVLLRLFPQSQLLFSTQFPLAVKGPTGTLHYAFHLCSQLRHSTCNLLRQYIPKTSKSLGFAFEQLVVLHGVLDEFTGVDVWISSLLNVTYDVLWDVDMEIRRGAGEGEEVVDEGFAVTLLVDRWEETV